MKIKSIKQLNAKKNHLRQRQTELEKAIKYDWRDLKETLKPENVAGQVLSKVFEEKEKKNKSTFVTESVSQIAAAFTGKLIDKAEQKVKRWFKK